MLTFSKSNFFVIVLVKWVAYVGLMKFWSKYYNFQEVCCGKMSAWILLFLIEKHLWVVRYLAHEPEKILVPLWRAKFICFSEGPCLSPDRSPEITGKWQFLHFEVHHSQSFSLAKDGVNNNVKLNLSISYEPFSTNDFSKYWWWPKFKTTFLEFDPLCRSEEIKRPWNLIYAQNLYTPHKTFVRFE